MRVRLLPTEALLPGVPSADKLAIFRLTEYDRVIFVDADVLVLRPLNALFAAREDFAVAHHPYDMVQAGCALPTRRRGVGALFAVRPSRSTFDALLRFTQSFSEHHLRHYSEQTALSCFFANRSRTLDCGFLFDLANPMARRAVAKESMAAHDR
eukprot:1352853-Prymnesium_polylepis.1